MRRHKAAAQEAAPTEEPTTITETIDQVVEDAQQRAADTSFDPEKLEKQPFAERVRRADPFPSHSYQWPDGYRVSLQESDSRKTVEIQFGDGSRDDMPQAFEQIKPYLRGEGFYWNGSNAWVVDLTPERGSLAQREDARRTNRDIRARVEDVILPAVVAMEEEKRGQIEVTDETRQRINKARGGVGGPG